MAGDSEVLASQLRHGMKQSRVIELLAVALKLQFFTARRILDMPPWQVP